MNFITNQFKNYKGESYKGKIVHKIDSHISFFGNHLTDIEKIEEISKSIDTTEEYLQSIPNRLLNLSYNKKNENENIPNFNITKKFSLYEFFRIDLAFHYKNEYDLMF